MLKEMATIQDNHEPMVKMVIKSYHQRRQSLIIPVNGPPYKVAGNARVSTCRNESQLGKS